MVIAVIITSTLLNNLPASTEQHGNDIKIIVVDSSNTALSMTAIDVPEVADNQLELIDVPSKILLLTHWAPAVSDIYGTAPTCMQNKAVCLISERGMNIRALSICC